MRRRKALPHFQETAERLRIQRQQSLVVRYAGLTGRTIVHGLLALLVWRMGEFAAVHLRVPLNRYTLLEIAVYALMAVAVLFLGFNMFRPPEDETTLRLWALSSLLVLSGMIFTLTVWFH